MRCGRCRGTGEEPDPSWLGMLRSAFSLAGWLAASEISRLMGWPHSTTTERLERLARSGLVEVDGNKRHRRWRWFATPPPVRDEEDEGDEENGFC